MRFAQLCLLFFVWGMLFVGVCDAQNKKLTKAEKDQFNALVTQATNDFKTQEFAKAIDGYKKAYNIDTEPALLVAIGQCYRSLNKYEQAIDSYKQYLDAKPNAPDKTAIEETIKALERLVAQGTLDFSTDPDNAQLYIDGELKGPTPITITGIEPGQHKIKATKDGYETFEKTFNFAPGQRQSIGITLEALEGAIEVASEQDPLTIFINGAFINVSPVKIPIKAGEYLVQVKKKNFQGSSETIKVEPGKTIALHPILEPGFGSVEIKINLKDAEVSIGEGLTKKTDNSGYCLFEGVPAGRQQVKIVRPPFQDSTQTILVKPEETETIETYIKAPPLPKILFGVSGGSLVIAGVSGIILGAASQGGINRDFLTGASVVGVFAFGGTFLVSGGAATLLFVNQRAKKITENREMKKSFKDKQEDEPEKAE